MQELSVHGVSFTTAGSESFVALKTVEAEKFVLFPVERSEAAALVLELERDSGDRSLANDFVSGLIEDLFGDVRHVFTELQDRRLRSVIVLGVGDAQLEVEARPSEALAVALRSGAPIYASDELVREASVDFEEGGLLSNESLVAEFRQFLNQVDPGDFS